MVIFADYSAELTRKRKLFSKVCTVLYQKYIKFKLAYPATLHLQMPEGAQRSSHDPDEAEGYITRLTTDAENSSKTNAETPQHQLKINHQLLTTPNTPCFK